MKVNWDEDMRIHAGNPSREQPWRRRRGGRRFF